MRPLNIKNSLPVLLVAFVALFSSCWGALTKPRPTGEPPFPEVQPEAYVPIYGYDSARYAVKAMPVQPTVQGGKIYVWGNYLFQIEQMKGIHVINYADRQNPVKLGFIGVKGCSELAVKGNHLITNNMGDMVVIDMRSINDVKEVGRIKMAFPQFNIPEFNMPPERNKYFVCPDQSKGDIVGWTLEKDVKRAYCYSN